MGWEGHTLKERDRQNANFHAQMCLPFILGGGGDGKFGELYYLLTAAHEFSSSNPHILSAPNSNYRGLAFCIMTME